MRVQVKDAPAQALRAMFAGIGQFLSITDKLRGKSATETGTAAQRTVDPEAAKKTGAGTGAAKAEAPEPASAEAAAAETVVPETAAPETAAPETKSKTAAKPPAAKPAEVAPEAEAAPGGHVKLLQPDEAAEPAATATGGSAAVAELPLANYDDLSIASLRARLRNLSAGQLGQLIEYEQSHAGRTDVITMFERRIAKLAEG